jgi:hypothetical protein
VTNLNWAKVFASGRERNVVTVRSKEGGGLLSGMIDAASAASAPAGSVLLSAAINSRGTCGSSLVASIDSRRRFSNRA